MLDRNFDGMAERFEQRIYGSSKGVLREEMIWRHLTGSLPALTSGSCLKILDAAGGLGQMTGRMLALGHDVVLNDISQDMLARAEQRLAVQLSGQDKLRLHHGAVQTLCEQNPSPQFDLVVCHALLEWLAKPLDTLSQMLALVRAEGYLSLAFYNRHSLVLNNALKGNVEYLLPRPEAKKPRRKGLSPPNAQFPEDVLARLEKEGMEVLAVSGIRVLHDWLPKEQQDMPLNELLELEQYYAEREPYKFMGRYVHVLARRERI
ncbi:MAG: methyltransferase [Pseudomonadales bacterium]